MMYAHPEKGVPTIPDLLVQIKKYYGLDENEEVSIAKYFNPSPFDWRVLDPEEEVVVKKKKKELQGSILNVATKQLKLAPR